MPLLPPAQPFPPSFNIVFLCTSKHIKNLCLWGFDFFPKGAGLEIFASGKASLNQP